VWEHFFRDSVRQTAQCKLCKASLKTGRGSTRSLHTHLQVKHDINILKWKRAADSSSDDEGNGANNSTNVLKSNIHKNGKSASACGSTVMKYILKPNDSSLTATVAHLTACDGFSFCVFATSTDMCRLFAAGFTNLLKSASSIQTLVSEHRQVVRSYVTTDLAERKAKGPVWHHIR